MNHRVLDRRRLLITLAALERRLWQPLGFAKLGVLYARGGAWQGHQLVPRDWVQGPTVVPTDDGSNPAPRKRVLLVGPERPPAASVLGQGEGHAGRSPNAGDAALPGCRCCSGSWSCPVRPSTWIWDGSAGRSL
jgi:hypothetical protein